MSLLDYRKFLIVEADTKSIVATDTPGSSDILLGNVESDKVERIKSQIQLFSLEAIIDNVAQSSGDAGFAQQIKTAMSSLSADKLIGISYVLSHKEKVKFDPTAYTGSPSKTLWDQYVAYFTTDLPTGAVPLSDGDLKTLWQIQQNKTRGSVGPGEIILSIFTDLKKGSSGDLQGNGFSMEVKGQNAKGESPYQWKNVKDKLVKLLEEDGLKVPGAKGFGKEWIDIVTQWIKKNPDTRLPMFSEMITGSTDASYVEVLKISLNSARAGYQSNIDYGVFTAQFIWYSKDMGFKYLLVFANPVNNAPISLAIDMSGASTSIYNTFVSNFQSPAWEEVEMTGGLKLNGSK
jgi:hypothetical protein